ncbi:N-acetylglucosamine-6-phosphate deacetylase [Roseicyclus mahoneyensis]|uniref:N-acetylglucosamine 6-phosphate deacetylase n=1 Tax=Roseicyclus mahoneyensis TaxID=164332 RepID=A0A316GP80_9RHOB|nr:N-acetylglucosamine-6-phosphate deacetylase [Roseicyclus mahoneyensis]PWK62478.1 N-acetylglucosamine 6-phosphate deacetylase [Roseicyclus mahoneyensis]
MTLYSGLDILDGDGLRADMALRLTEGQIAEVRHRQAGEPAVDLSQDGQRALVCPGFLDLQVNGGAGLMLGECTTPGDVSRLASAHRAGGTTGLMPTLISDSGSEITRIIDLVAQAATDDPAILGLHLEGPHIAVAGAHDPAQLRPMTDADLMRYKAAAAVLPHLLITLAPEQVTHAQIAALTEAGVTVSLGHSSAGYDAAKAAYAAGAGHVTHLFNAMSGLHHREPGMVGAALDHAPWIGLIADGVHVHDAGLRLAWATARDRLILVTDAMAVAGTSKAHFNFAGRRITRAGGRLTLADGTLAGADITMIDAVRHMARATGASLTEVLPLAFDAPHRLVTGQPNRITPGRPARLLCLAGDRLTSLATGEGWQRI